MYLFVKNMLHVFDNIIVLIITHCSQFLLPLNYVCTMSVHTLIYYDQPVLLNPYDT